jgi:cytochrome oxidase Cu insertion factor (SCO1/SenC/PrrC family)/thiol-disulfide isomerase/thioredoxin
VTPSGLRRIAIAGTAVLVALLAALAIVATVNKGQGRPASSVPAPLATGTALSQPRRLPATTLIDEQGKPISFSQWRGKWVVLAPSLTLCHEVCPMTTGALTELTTSIERAGLSRQVVVAEATVDPWRDSPSRLRAYRRLSGANFTMLTGTPAEISKLWKFFGVYYARVPQGNPPDEDWLTHKPETFDVQHTDGIFFIDPAGQERIAEQGMPSVTSLSPTLRALLNDRGRENLAHPQTPWTAAQALDDLYYLMNRNVPASSVPKVVPPSAAQAQSALRGSPGALAAIHSQGGQLLGSGDALSERLKALRGYPVVLNAWAAWCPPCRMEFGLFASAAARFGRRVAFLGVDTNDTPSDARQFLSEHPVSYPSYQMSTAQLAPLTPIAGMPTTIYLAPSGKIRNVHTGQYATQTTLQNDIQRYALGG